ncbi:MAG: hypothetical protein M1835_006869 [Candelina submexicana]|nr:MAG: hypothetical protein M1835_006869 [Candelina submexicana]
MEAQRSALLDHHLKEHSRSHNSRKLTAPYSALPSPFETPPASPESPNRSVIMGEFGTDEAYMPYGRRSETCANCYLSLPKDLSEQMPNGMPGSPTKDGKGRNGSPVLRTREVMISCCSTSAWDEDADWGDSSGHSSTELDPSHPSTSGASTASSTSSTYNQPHTHTLTYLTARNPPSPGEYSLLRRSCIRALSCESLPRGTASGPVLFGDHITGYTMAYIFRLPDSRARGRRRSYALVALGGRDRNRVAALWTEVMSTFSWIAGEVTQMAESVAEEEAMREREVHRKFGGRDITPVSSFLSGRTVDPDGYPRRAGDIRAKGLAEIVGREDLFVDIHRHFVKLLSHLAREHGGYALREDSFENGICDEV